MYASEVVYLSLDLDCQAGQRLVGALHPGIAVKIFLGVLLGSEIWIQRNPDFFAGIVVVELTAFGTCGDGITIGVEKLSVNLEFIALFCVPDLAALQVIFVYVPFQNSLDNVSQVR